MKQTQKLLLLSLLPFLLSSCDLIRCEANGSIEVKSPQLQATIIKTITSPPVIQQTIDTLNWEDKNSEPLSIEEFASNLVVKPAKSNPRLFRISYQHRDEETALFIVNNIMRIWIEEVECRTLKHICWGAIPPIWSETEPQDMQDRANAINKKLPNNKQELEAQIVRHATYECSTLLNLIKLTR